MDKITKDQKLKIAPKRGFLFSTKGSALVLAMVVSAILLIVMLVGVMMIRQQTHLVSGSRRKSEALSIAEAGLDAAIWRLEKNQVPTSGITTFSGYNTQGQYSVSINPVDSYHYVVTAEGNHTASSTKKKVVQDVYYINLSRSIFSYNGTTGSGGAVEGNVNIMGPFYTGGDLNLGGNVGIFNINGTTGNPIMVRGDLNLNSGSVNVGTAGSPMAVFVKGTIDRPAQVHNLVSKTVPEISMPEVIRSQYLDAAQGNDNAVYVGNLTLGNDDKKFGKRADNSYTFDYNGSTGTLTTEGTIYIDGNLTFSKSLINYKHNPTGITPYTKSTIFANGQIKILGEIKSLVTYPSSSVLALVNEDTSFADDFHIDVSGGNSKQVQSFIYSVGRVTINKQVTVNGTIIAKLLWLNQVPTLIAPAESASANYPYLFPGKDLSFLTTTNWREGSVE